jgi:hypothetical protein
MSETGDLDTLAAEYVLGTLDGPERAQAQAVLGVDEAFAAKVRIWERRLGELHLMVEPVEPDGGIWERIKGKMPAPEPSQEPAPPPEPEQTEPKEPVPATAADTTSAAPAVGAVPIPSPVTVPPTLPTAPILSPSAEPVAKLPPAPVLAVPGPPTPVARAPMVERADDSMALRRRLRRWRLLAALLILIVLAAGALVAAWKYAPERVPPALQASELLRVVGITVAPTRPVRRPAPPESQFDE